MEIEVSNILAVITLNMELVSGGAPIFFARNEEEMEKVAGHLSKILDAMVHDLGNGSYVVVRH
ncbi:capping complex subunit for YIEGIA [Pelotomaculum propionicicum]|uniref:capping complex subunit for YIEGIA n=1 Tax=Pelotomaculum propionicicum TaxID=258475 RepID=UPI003B7A72E8